MGTDSRRVRQIFKGEVLTRTKVVNNILRIWDRTDDTDRFDWYLNANVLSKILSKKYEVPDSKVIGYIAALSPLKRWEQNLILAENYVRTGSAGHMKQFLDKCEAITKSNGTDEEILEILRGRKISSFYLNIKYYESANYITIDRHALSVALGYWVDESDYSGMTAAQYDFFVQCYCLAAAKVDVLPLRMQSATWVKWRQIKTEFKKK